MDKRLVRHTVVETSSAPLPSGPYSQAIRADDFIFLSGQAGYLADSRALSDVDIDSQTRQTIRNIEEILAGAGSDLSHVVKVTVYLAHITDRNAMNNVYSRLMPRPYPARTTVAATLYDGLLIEMDVVARVLGHERSD